MPVPIWLTTPAPAMAPLKVTVSDRLNASVPLFVTPPEMSPEVPPLPSCSVPPVMVVPPL